METQTVWLLWELPFGKEVWADYDNERVLVGVYERQDAAVKDGEEQKELSPERDYKVDPIQMCCGN